MAEHAVFFGEDDSVIIDRNKIAELILDDPLWQGRAIPHTPPASPKNTVHSLRYFDIDYEKRCIDDYYESPMDFIHGAQEKVETEFGMTLQGCDTELVWAGSEAWAKVDLLASREQLLADFKLWLDSMELPIKNNFDTDDFHAWVNHRVIEYIDLEIWAVSLNKKLRNELAGDVLYGDMDLDRASKIRKTTARIAEYIMSDSSITQLERQASTTA